MAPSATNLPTLFSRLRCSCIVAQPTLTLATGMPMNLLNIDQNPDYEGLKFGFEIRTKVLLSHKT